MQIINKLTHIPNLSLVLGFFDGVHIAHQKLIKNGVNFALQNKTQSAVVTFKQQPFCYLHNIEPKYISTREESYKLIENLGVDYIIEIDFKEISKMSSYDYLKNILIKYFSPAGIFTGFNHHFGQNRQGDCEFLEQHHQEFGYNYYSLPSQTLEGNIISSSSIRKYLEQGKIENANAMLGRKFSVKGTVIEGNKIGRTINFPTANIAYPKSIIQIPNGAYGVEIILNNHQKLKGVANFGTKPTICQNSEKVLETHILEGFNKDIYGQNIEVHFINYIRPETKFDTIEDLKSQIKKDILTVTKDK